MRLGSVQQAVKCAVMPLLLGVDVILGQQFMTSHNALYFFLESTRFFSHSHMHVVVFTNYFITLLI
jgi:hypothetical protein